MISIPYKSPFLPPQILQNKEFILLAAQKGFRIDGRDFSKPRKLSVSHHGNGSCTITLGKTRIRASTTHIIGAPLSNRPNEGTFHISVRLSPLGNPLQQPKHILRGIDPSNLSRTLENIILGSSAIQLESLCISDNVLVFHIYSTIDILYDDGNLLSACSYALAASIQAFTLPNYTVSGTKIIKSSNDVPFPLQFVPISVQFSFLPKVSQPKKSFSSSDSDESDSDDSSITQGNLEPSILCDSNKEEESCQMGDLCIFCTPLGDICSINKSGGLGIKPTDLFQLIQRALSVCKSYSKVIGTPIKPDLNINMLPSMSKSLLDE